MNFHPFIVKFAFEYDFILETLIDQTFLSFSAVLDLLSIHADQSVEECVKFVIGILFCPHYSTHSLNFLSSGFIMHSQLDTYIRAGQINGSVTNSTQKQDVDFFCRFEQVVYLDSLVLWYLAMNVRYFQFFCVIFEDFWSIAKNKNLIVTIWVFFKQVL